MKQEFILQTLQQLKAQAAEINKRIEYLTTLATTLKTKSFREPKEVYLGDNTVVILKPMDAGPTP